MFVVSYCSSKGLHSLFRVMIKKQRAEVHFLFLKRKMVSRNIEKVAVFGKLKNTNHCIKNKVFY